MTQKGVMEASFGKAGLYLMTVMQLIYPFIGIFFNHLSLNMSSLI